MFHVKPYEASEAETNKFVSISEPIKVAIAKAIANAMASVTTLFIVDSGTVAGMTVGKIEL